MPTPPPYVVTGAISFSGVSLEKAPSRTTSLPQDTRHPLGRRRELGASRHSEGAAVAPSRLDASYAPTTAPTRKMPTPAPSLVPTGATALAPTAADGVSVDYNVSVPSISEAEAVEAVGDHDGGRR